MNKNIVRKIQVFQVDAQDKAANGEEIKMQAGEG